MIIADQRAANIPQTSINDLTAGTIFKVIDSGNICMSIDNWSSNDNVRVNSVLLGTTSNSTVTPKLIWTVTTAAIQVLPYVTMVITDNLPE